MRWVEIEIDALQESVDAISNILIEEGCGGTTTGGLVALSQADVVSVRGYLPVDDRLEARLENIRSRLHELPEIGLGIGSDEIRIKWVQEEDWANAWKKHFKPIRVGKIIIKPSWEEYSAQPGDIIIELDPGMAFGTGSHETTKLCLEALQKYIKGGETVFDMGTGSGILAIAASKLGASRVVGLDVDTVAVEVAEKNVDHVGLQDKVVIGRAESPDAFDGTADIVLANIIAKIIIEMAAGLYEKTKPGGILVTSGIIRERADEVRAQLIEVGFKILDEQQDGEWVAIICRRP